MHSHKFKDKEVWVQSPTYDFLLVSSHGRLMHKPYEKAMPNGGVRTYGGKAVFGTKITNEYGYSRMRFNSRVNKVQRWVHQLVCEAFHGCKPFAKAVVMHIDDDATNNHKDNLKWGTQKENLNSEKFLAFCRSRTGDNHPLYRTNR